ncbi:hypothetical protein CDAR_19201 [Caerostris darwini]|uniref:Uncharacterized protein n=1 Tax=Caerostris darwini TaxID=1538125 RepID=A0AAV4WEG1_9ARAC|nr:hypothetical protein CDAR_19201 [Caerostris darwini]
MMYPVQYRDNNEVPADNMHMMMRCFTRILYSSFLICLLSIFVAISCSFWEVKPYYIPLGFGVVAMVALVISMICIYIIYSQEKKWEDEEFLISSQVEQI